MNFEPTTVAGQGLTLRPLTTRDADAVAAACADPITQQWLPLPRSYGRAEALHFIEVFAPSVIAGGDGIVFAVEADSDGPYAQAGEGGGPGRVVGCIDMKHTDWSTRCTETGYWVGPWARGHGIGAVAARLVGEWALRLKGLERVELRAATDNRASRRVAERAGYRFEGVARNAGYVYGGRVDLHVYSLTPDDLR